MADEIPDLLVELLLLGELPEPEASVLRGRLAAAGDPRLEQLARSNAEVLERYPPSMMAAALRRALGEPPRARGRGWRAGVVGLAAAAALALVWVVRPDAADPISEPAEPPGEPAEVVPLDEPAERVRDKGGERLVVHRKLPTGAEQLRPGSRVAPGDVLQLGYVPGDRSHGVIVSLDGVGAVTLHWPASPDDDTALADGPTELDYAFELDGSPGFERFFFVTASQPLPVHEVMGAARALAQRDDARRAPLRLREGWAQRDLLLDKRDD